MSGIPSLTPDAILDLRPQAVVVLREVDSEHLVEEFVGRLRAAGRDDVTVVVLAGEASIETLDEVSMRAAGWVRADPGLLDIGIVHDRTLDRG